VEHIVRVIEALGQAEVGDGFGVVRAADECFEIFHMAVPELSVHFGGGFEGV
jgi:hypothetical protein